jgi:uncharacterized protein (TIGR00159 family)
VLRSVLELVRQVRLADVLDVLIVTGLVSAGMAFVRRTRAGFVAVGLIGLTGLYVVASAFDMQLTAAILAAFFAFAVVIVVVIFQDQLRQLFESIAMLGRRTTPGAAALAALSGRPTEVLVSTLTECARRRVGALVVVPGRQSIERYVQGGIDADARLSVPLLLSIFDPHSPGHDGAVIVEGDRVRRFAAHLPLSRDFTQLHSVGTRHSAALGLAEITDACCLVVSEERGEISVAMDGRLERGVEAPRLTAALGERDVAGDHAPEGNGWARWWRQGWGERLAVLAVVIGLWLLFVPGGRPAERTISVGVEAANLPSGYVLAETVPAAVDVTLAGTRRSFYLLAPERVTVEVDASLASLGRRSFTLNEDNVRFVPPSLSVVDVNPAKVRLELNRVD